MRIGKLASLGALALAACSAGNGADNTATQPKPARTTADEMVETGGAAAHSETALQRIEAIQRAVTDWRNASDFASAKRHAEAARNLIVGPEGPGYGDADGDGTVAASNRVGLLPGTSGGPSLAIPAINACVTRDLLGGSWDDAERRWAILKQKIGAWRPENNTFPTLPSHAQRVVGWATLTLRADDVATAREYADHAQIHVDVMRRALSNC